MQALAPLMERERELSALNAVVASACAGEGAVAVVEGPPGIGKSRLLSAVRETTVDACVLRARASELDRAMPFGVVRQLIEPVIAAADDAERARLLRGPAELAVPVLAEVGGTDLRGAEEPALHGLHWLTINLAGERPVVIVVDDLHWADPPSLRWLVYLAQRIEGVPVALLLATRPDEPGAVGDLIDALLALPATELISPAVLSAAAVTDMASRVLGAPAEPAFVAACQSVTGGNPFLLRELLGELATSRVAPTAAAATTVARLSSEAVSRSAMTRLRRLPDACRELAEAVLTLGDDTELERAAHLAQLDLDTAAEAADALEAAFVFAPGRPLAFVHPLVRASVYAKLSASSRASLHARAAMMLTSEGASPERIAGHWLSADPAGSPGAVETLRAAAGRACRAGAPASAAAYLRRALREPPAQDVVPRVTLELGIDELSTYDAAAAFEHFRAAYDSLSEPADRGQAAHLLGVASMFAGQASAEVIGLLDHAISELPESERELGLMLESTCYSVAHLHVHAWRAYKERSRRFTCDGPATSLGERLYLGILAGDAGRTGTADRARELALAAIGGGQLLESLRPGDPTFYIPVSTLFFCDATAEALRELQRILDWARRSGSRLAISFASNFRAMSWMRCGMLNEVEIEATDLIDGAGSSASARNGLVAVCEARVFRGDVEGATALWETASLDELMTPTRRLTDYYLQGRARLRIAQGRVNEALEDLFACGDVEQAYDVTTPQSTTWRADAAVLLLDLGRADDARPLVDEELVRARSFGSARQIGTALRAAARLEDGEQALELHREAEEVFGASNDRLGHAVALADLGGALRRAGERKRARDYLSRAVEAARACGATPVATQAHDELVAAGARPRRDPTESRSQLTASETRVARMAAQGMTNREIAQTLFLTEKTIELHLTNSYRKLDIGSRSQLARALAPETDAAAV